MTSKNRKSEYQRVLSLFLSLASILFYSTAVQSQILDPIHWSTVVKKETATDATLVITATMDPGWHIYALKGLSTPKEGGPILTSVTFTKSTDYTRAGGISAPDPKKEFSPQFDMDLEFFEESVSFEQKIKKSGTAPFEIDIAVEYMSCDNERCLPPKRYRGTVHLNQSGTPTPKSAGSKGVKTSNSSEGKNLLSIFILSFLGGLAALFTPCVFPMIPLTVSFFTKQSDKKKGKGNVLLYMGSIIFIYVALGVGITSIFGAGSLNALSTSIYFNLFFFILLVLFAASFLGAFEISLPSKWVTSVDKKSAGGGAFGIFFMAFSLALVSFSCTGPIIGTLIVDAAVHGGFVGPTVGMLGFSTALALPFGLFALFPQWLKSMPKSGGWLNSVKVVLGFLELALALKFLSNVDLVLQLHLLEREVFISLWVAIFTMLGLYLIGAIKLPHDSPMERLSVPRLFLAILTFSFTVYLIPGIWGGASLQLISGFPPPTTYSENGLKTSIGSVAHTAITGSSTKRGPHNITLFLDFDAGVAQAKKENKPILLDFTGHACVNCRKMEDYVWSDPRISQVLRNEVVVISLYVDDKRPLDPSDRFTSTFTGEEITTIGEKWSEFQTYKYGANAQPYYVVADHFGTPLLPPKAYDRDVASYLKWLKEGIALFAPHEVGILSKRGSMINPRTAGSSPLRSGHPF